MQESKTTESDKEPIVFRMKKNGDWADVASVERRDEVRELREKKRLAAKERL